MGYTPNYSSRNFVDIRTELLNYVKQYYPDTLSDFNDASVGTMLLELNAATGDILSYHTDRMFQETQVDYANERRSLFNMARTMGVKIPNKRPSVSVVNWSVIVPVKGDTFDVDYAPIIKRGSQCTGAGKVFEILDDVDFSSPYNSGGIPNRLIIPNRDANGVIQNYTLVKQEIVFNGITKIFKRVISENDSRPFLEVFLPDDDVLSIEDIIILPGTNYQNTPTLSQFSDPTYKWYEVDSLSENKVFMEDSNSSSDRLGVSPGIWTNISKRFLKEYTDLGFCKIIFGSGVNNISFSSEFDENCAFLVEKIGDFINNNSLGEVPPANSTMFVRYRVGGGADTNLGSNVLVNLGLIDISVNGSDNLINNNVRRSLEVTNPIPAVGGANEPSIEQLRWLIKYNFSSQNRCVTVKDYKSRIDLMPGKFGVPFRSNVWEEQNKINVSILSLDEDLKLSNQSNSTLKNNIAEYLSDYRMINDYIVIRNGRIYNLSLEVDLFVDKSISRSEIISTVIDTITEYFSVNNQQMGQNIYLSNLLEKINNISGVKNVIDIRIYNKIGEGRYSLNEVTQSYIDETTRQIDTTKDYTLYADPDSMFEIKFPEKDIKIRVK